MILINLDDAQLRFKELVHHVEAGDPAYPAERKRNREMTSIARPKKAVDKDMLRALTTNRTLQTGDAGSFVRSLRDSDRY